MSCPKCGKDNLPGARFCMNCGSALAAPPQPNSPDRSIPPGAPRPQNVPPGAPVAAPGFRPMPMDTPMPVQADDKRPLIVGVILAVIVLLAGAVAFSKLGGVAQQNATPQTGDAVTATRTPSGGALAERTATPTAPPVTNQTAKAPLPPPADIVAWLEHLRRTEEMRKQIGAEAQGIMMNMAITLKVEPIKEMLKQMDDPSAPDPGQSTVQAVEDQVAQLQASFDRLNAFFRSKTPPQECQGIANDYFRVLFTQRKVIMNIVEAIRKADLGLAKAQNNEVKPLNDTIIECNRKIRAIEMKYNFSANVVIEREGSLSLGDSPLGAGL